MEALHIVELFAEIADEVRSTVAGVEDRGESGRRPGQYTLDLHADEVVLQRLHDAGFAVLSEESGRTNPEGEMLVVVDPVDGSTNASLGLPWFATSLCAIDEHGPLASLVLNLATGDRYDAVRGGGARRNGAPISPSACTSVGDAIVAVSGLPRSNFGWRQFRCYGAAALDICAVADGTFDAFMDLSIDAHGAWDYLGAVLVLAEAGGAVVDWHDRDLVVTGHGDRRTPVAAANPELLHALRQAGADQHA